MVVILSKLDEHGKELFVGQYDTPDKAMAAVKEAIQPQTYEGGGVTVVSFTSGEYLLREMGMATQARVIPPVLSKAFNIPAVQVVPRKLADEQYPLAARYIRVQSMTDKSVQYEVGVSYGGYSVSCSCPDFKNRRHRCKHMLNTDQRRTMYGRPD